MAGDRALPDGSLKLLHNNLSALDFDLCTETVESLAVDSWMCDGNPPAASVITQVDLFQVKLTADSSLNRDRLIGSSEKTLDRDFTLIQVREPSKAALLWGRGPEAMKCED